MPSTVSGFTEAVSEPSAPVEAVMVGPIWWVSVRSTSASAIVPLSVRFPAGVTCSVTALVTSAVATTGSSFVPVMVTTKVCDVTPPSPSSIATV